MTTDLIKNADGDEFWVYYDAECRDWRAEQWSGQPPNPPPHAPHRTRSKDMTLITEITDRASLEIAAIFECEFALDVVEAASDEELRDMIREWIAAGDECA